MQMDLSLLDNDVLMVFDTRTLEAKEVFPHERLR